MPRSVSSPEKEMPLRGVFFRELYLGFSRGFRVVGDMPEKDKTPEMVAL